MTDCSVPTSQHDLDWIKTRFHELEHADELVAAGTITERARELRRKYEATIRREHALFGTATVESMEERACSKQRLKEDK